MDHQQEVKNMPFWRRWSNKRRHTSAECHASWQRSGSVRSLQRRLHTAALCALLFSEAVLPQLPSDTPCRTPLPPPLEPHMDTNTSGQHGLQTEVSKTVSFFISFHHHHFSTRQSVLVVFFFFTSSHTGTGSFPAATLLPWIYSYILLHTSQ